MKRCAVWLVFLTSMYAIAQARAPLNPVAYTAALPSAPQPAQSTQPTASPATAGPQRIAGISGTVLDTSGDVLQGASINLLGPSHRLLRTIKSGANGQFAFSSIAPGTYRLTVNAPGMCSYASVPIALHPGEIHFMPPIRLAISVNTVSVTVVGGDKRALSIQQVKIAEQQRIVGVIPNFYTTYNWNAPPMEAKQKFQLGFRSVLDPASFAAIAGLAGAEQYFNAFPEYGGGFSGYAKRYGAAYTTHFTADMLSHAVYPTIFHQDPRYFYKGRGSFGSRALYAISSAFITRGDNGQREPNYSGILGNFSAAGISNLYYPAAERGASLVLFNGLADTGADVGLNLLREFVLKSLTTRASSGN